MFFFKPKYRLEKASDEDLIASYRQTEDNRYLGVLLDRYAHLAFLVCMKYLKDEEESRDAVMQVFERLIGDLLRYEVKQFRFWLHTILKNHCLALLEKKKRLPLGNTDVYAYGIAEEEDDLEWKTQFLALLPEAIHQLSFEQQICIELFYLQEKSYQEVSQQTGYDLKKVKSYIQNGKRNMKIWLEKREKQMKE